MMCYLALLWEAPLALASFALFRTLRFLLRRLAFFHQARHPEQQRVWRVMSGELVNKPLVLPLLMTEGPRWNTNAVIGLVGPVITKSFRIRRAPMASSAQFWSLVCHRTPGHRLVAAVSSLTASDDGDSIEIALPPGRYILALRYYRYADQVTFPDVEVDGSPVVAPLTVPSSVNNFYRHLIRRQNVFYLFLHYYVYVLLKYRHLLPAARIDREFLPLRNSQTNFYYGLVPRNTRLQIELPADLLATHEAAVTLYTLGSFPLTWCRLTEKTVLPACPVRTSYLVRIQAIQAGAGFHREDVKISTEPDGSSGERLR